MKLITLNKGPPKYAHRLFSVLAIIAFNITIGWFLSCHFNSVNLEPISDEGISNDIVSTNRQHQHLIADSLRSTIETPYSRIYSQFYPDSIAHFGSQENLYNTLLRLFYPPKHEWLVSTNNERRQIRIAVIGGSATIPHGIKAEAGFFSLFCGWLSRSFSELGLGVLCQNWAIGATDSSYFSLCIDEFLNVSDFDILILELALNDVKPSSGIEFEQLIRVLLDRNPRLHIISVQFPNVKQLLVGKQASCPAKGMDTPESVQLRIAQHYNITVIRARHFFCNDNWNIGALTNARRSKLAEIYVSKVDGFHPSEQMHLMMTEFLIAYFRETLRLLVFNRILASPNFIEAFDRQVGVHRATRDARFDVECFVSYNWNDRLNRRLVDSIVPEVNSLLKVEENSLDILSGIWLDHYNASVEFQLSNMRTSRQLRCSNGGYLPRLAIAHKLEYAPSKGDVAVEAKFTFSDRSVISANYRLNLTVLAYRPNYIEEMLPESTAFISDDYFSAFTWQEKQRLCSRNAPLIDRISLRFQQRSPVDYPLSINTILVLYECCTLQAESGDNVHLKVSSLLAWKNDD